MTTIKIIIVISRFLKRYLKAKRTRAPAYSRALRRIRACFSKRVVKRNSGPISRIPAGDKVAVKVGVVQMGRVNESGNINENESNGKINMIIAIISYC